MCRHICLFVAFLAVIGASTARAQSTQEQVNEVRRQMDSLKRHLEKLEANDRKDDRVTEIGSRSAQAREVGLVLRLYDISDLFAIAPNYHAKRLDDFGVGGQPLFTISSATGTASGFGSLGGGMGGGGGMFAVAPTPVRALPNVGPNISAQFAPPGTAATANTSDSRTSIDDLIAAIMVSIAPTAWTEVGGNSSIKHLGNALLISAEPDTHEQIESLLAQFRQRWKSLRTVTLAAWWLSLTDEQLAQLLPDHKGSRSQYGAVDDAAWQKRPAGAAAYRSTLTCYNGQTVYTLCGGESLAITDVEATVLNPQAAKDAQQALFRPKVTILQDGAALQVTPLVTSSGKYVVLDVHSRVARIHSKADAKPTDEKAAKAPADITAMVNAIDRPVVNVQLLSTTLRVPVDEVVLIGGMNFDATPSEATGANLYLFVRIAVQELADDQPKAEPVLLQKH